MKTFLAPLAGYSDRAMREICRIYGADICFTEMINVNTIINVPDKAIELMQIKNEKSPVAIQIFGTEEENLSKGAEILDKRGIDYIDLNCGCPVKKIVKTGAGSALLKDEEKLKSIIGSLRDVIKDALFSIKIRLGWDFDNLNYLNVGKIAEKEGVDFITLHARTRSQQFGGKADWQHIKYLNQYLSIPVVGNGDIISWEDAFKKKELSGVSAIMIGRKAIERPYIFSEIEKKQDLKLTKKEIKNLLLLWYKKKMKYYEEYKAVREMRKIVHRFIRGYRYSKKLRVKINEIEDFNGVKKLFERYLDSE